MQTLIRLLLLQTVQTKIRLLQKEQSDLGLHCLPFHMYLLDVLTHCKNKMFNFKSIVVCTLGIFLGIICVNTDFSGIYGIYRL